MSSAVSNMVGKPGKEKRHRDIKKWSITIMITMFPMDKWRKVTVNCYFGSGHCGLGSDMSLYRYRVGYLGLGTRCTWWAVSLYVSDHVGPPILGIYQPIWYRCGPWQEPYAPKSLPLYFKGMKIKFGGHEAESWCVGELVSYTQCARLELQ